jgi:hypothetical protein
MPSFCCIHKLALKARQIPCNGLVAGTSFHFIFEDSIETKFLLCFTNAFSSSINYRLHYVSRSIPIVFREL